MKLSLTLSEFDDMFKIETFFEKNNGELVLLQTSGDCLNLALVTYSLSAIKEHEKELSRGGSFTLVIMVNIFFNFFKNKINPFFFTNFRLFTWIKSVCQQSIQMFIQIS